MEYTIGEVARMSGLSPRMLRHYDEIGLLAPAGRSISGYRQYDDTDLLRLQRILSFRATGMSLEDISKALDDPETDLIASLSEQAELIRQKIELLETQLVAVERTRKAKLMGVNLNPEEIFEVFGENDPTEYADEAKERWGETDAYKQSQARTSKYTKADWERAQTESAAIVEMFRAAMLAGLAAESDEAARAAEAHRQNITDWYYDCSYEIQAGLAEMYVADARFTEFYDKVEPGLAQYVSDAITANALKHL
jgi:DNA-binding transcriptional MerR regulator